MTTKDIEWDKEAEERINKAPFFVRKMARKKVEKAAVALGQKRITVELVEKVKQGAMGN